MAVGRCQQNETKPDNYPVQVSTDFPRLTVAGHKATATSLRSVTNSITHHWPWPWPSTPEEAPLNSDHENLKTAKPAVRGPFSIFA